MRIDTSLIVVSHEPALPPGMRRFSKATKGVLAALAVMLVSFGTSAQAADGPYVGIGGSLSILNDSEVTAPASGPYTPLNINATTDNGFAVRGMAGYAFSSGFRVEAEIDYRKHNTDEMDVKSPGSLVAIRGHVPSVAQGINAQATAAGLSAPYANPATTTYADLLDVHKPVADAAVKGSQPVNGAFSMLAFMANVDYDFDMGSPWKPYVGGGLGLAIISLDTETEAGTSLADDRDTVFAYQVGAGIGYEFPLSEGRSLTVSLDWRYFDTQSPTFKGDVTGAEFDVGISGHDIGIGLMYGF